MNELAPKYHKQTKRNDEVSQSLCKPSAILGFITTKIEVHKVYLKDNDISVKKIYPL